MSHILDGSQIVPTQSIESDPCTNAYGCNVHDITRPNPDPAAELRADRAAQCHFEPGTGRIIAVWASDML